MNSMKDKSHYSNYMRRKYLLSALTQKLQHKNWISFTKKVEENANRKEKLEKQTYDFSESLSNC